MLARGLTNGCSCERLRRQGYVRCRSGCRTYAPPSSSPKATGSQSAAIAASEREADDQAFVDATSDSWDSDDEQTPPGPRSRLRGYVHALG